MGIPDFLSRVLAVAGRPLDLRDYAEHGIPKLGSKRSRPQRRPMRIGVDVSTWVYQTTHGLGDMLGDERHLSNYGRADLHTQHRQQHELGGAAAGAASTAGTASTVPEETVEKYIQACTESVLKRLETLRDSSQAELLIVLDGKTPPMKSNEVTRRRAMRQAHVDQRDQPVDPNADPSIANAQRTKAFRRAGAGKYHYRVLEELQSAMAEEQISFLVAPYEADSQLAYMSKQGYIDLIITEDSDLVAYGTKAILYKSASEIGNGLPRGKLLRFVDLGAVQGKLNWTDFSPAMMAVLFVSVGCDYCEKLKGIGLLTASRIIRQAFLEPKPSLPSHGGGEKSQRRPPLAQVLSQLYQHSYINSFSEDFRREYEARFVGAILMYRHPIVYDPIKRACVVSGATPGGLLGDQEFMDFEPYARVCSDVNLLQQVIGEIPKGDVVTAIVEGRDKVRRRRLTADDEEAKAETAVGGPAEAGDVDTSDAEGIDPQTQEQVALYTQEQATQPTQTSEGSQPSKASRQDGHTSTFSPNLLYSSTPERTQGSQKTLDTHESALSSATKSPNLLYSSTPDKSTLDKSPEASSPAPTFEAMATQPD